MIATSRFNQTTWNENCIYRREKQIKGCIYGSPSSLSGKIPPNTSVFIVEMNNTTNRIEGIGLICNRPEYDHYYRIYETGNYNRYVYKSEYRIDRSTMLLHNKDLVKAFDHILFKEKTHMKRGAGITVVPQKLLQHKVCNHIDIHHELSSLFKEAFLS